MGARIADIFLINGRPPDQIKEIISDMNERAALNNKTLRFGMSAFVICRETEAAAELEYQRLLSLLNVNIKGGDKKVEMHKYLAETEKVGTNGGTVAGLVGTPEQIAERMREFESLGIETFLLQFHPTLEELERFSAEVIPLLN